MGLSCPNKNSKEWKMLVKQSGERLAELAFVDNGYTIPDVRPVTEIKKSIGFKSKTENFAGIARRLKAYNKSEGTSHSFTHKRIYGNTFELTLYPNYLPVNAEKQRQKLAEKNEMFRVESTSTERGFGNIYPYTPSTSEQAAGYFNEEGDFMPPLGETDFLVESAVTEVSAVEKKREKKIQTELRQLHHELGIAQDSKQPVKVKEILKRIEEKLREEERADVRVDIAGKIKAYEEVVEFGKKELEEVREMLLSPAISTGDMQYAQRVINLWLRAGDFSTPDNMHIILDEDEYNTPEIKQQFIALFTDAQELQKTLTPIQEDYITKFVQKYTSEGLSKDEIFAAIKDMPWLKSRTLNVGRSDDAMIQAIYIAVQEANIKAQQEAGEVWGVIDDLSSKFLKKTGGNFEILKQKTANGLETGRLVNRFSHEFYEERNKLMGIAFYQRDEVTGKRKKDANGIKDFFNWVNKNTITFDPRILIPDSVEEGGLMPDRFLYKEKMFNEDDTIAHMDELKKHLGEKGFDFYIKRVKKHIENFKTTREAIYEKIQGQSNLSQEERNAKFEEWQRENSPYWGVDMLQNSSSRKKGTGKGYYSPKGIRNYTEQVPRKFTNDGKTTEWYDKGFEKIEGDSDLLNYYDYVIETLNTLRYTLPARYQKVLGVGILPTIEKSIMDNFSEKGLMMGIAPFMDKMKQLQTTTDLATEIHSDIDPKTGVIEKEINIPFLPDVEAEVSQLTKTMLIRHKQETGKPATGEETRAYKAKARDMVSQEKSWDVTRIMKAHALSVLAHKHKSFIEPQVRMAIEAFEKRKQLVTNKAGVAQSTPKKDVAVEEGLKNLKESLNFFLDTTFFSVGGRKVEGVSKKKLYTKAEEKQKKELEALLENATEEKEIAHLQEQLDSLGGFRTASGTGDAALKFMTLKGLGWNLFSAFSNIGFGVISNLVQGSDGREFSMAQMRKAYALTMNSIGRNWTFNSFEGVDGNAIKIRTMMDKWDLLQTSNKELFDMTQKSSMSKLKRFGPYSMQERSEYLNYAPIMIATMLKFKGKDADGNEVDLWDAYGKDGKLKEGYATDIDETKMVLKMRRIIEMAHGDYNNPLLAKATFTGRALSQFRTWMFEGFANRFESEKTDHILGYGLDEPYLRKGRYRSYTKGQLTATGATLGTLFLPGIGTAIGAGAGWLGGKFAGMESTESGWSDTTFALKQLARKLMFQKTQYGDRFDAHDAANMRKNATELYILMTLMGIGVLLKALVDEDDEKENMFIANFLINQTTRLQTDIGFYTNPLEFEKLTKTALPLAQLVEDAWALRGDIQAFFNDDHKDDRYTSGPFKGDSKFLVHAGEMLPGFSQGIRLYRTGTKVW